MTLNSQIKIYCPDCDTVKTFNEVEPLDENLDKNGKQIREFECSNCGLAYSESEPEFRIELIDERIWND